jgi:hypothetical protein
MNFNQEGTPLEKLGIGKSALKLNYDAIEDITFDQIDFKDSPDFSDAYIDSALYEGREMTEEELDMLNEDRDYVYGKLMNHLY